MYLPPHFRLAVQHALIRAHPFGLLITAGPGGLQANPVPFLLDSGRSEKGMLRAHLARANPQLSELAASRECLIVFQGPQQYISPSWYCDKTRDGKGRTDMELYTVHAWGRPQIIDDADWLREQVGELTASQEDARDVPWGGS